MTDLPPPYDSILDVDVYAQLSEEHKDVLRALANLPHEARKAGARAAEKELTKDENIKKTLDEVRTLANNVLEINSLFEEVRLGLIDVDKKLEAYSKTSPKLEPEWKQYQDKWTTIFTESRTTASKTVAYIEEFLEVVLPKVKDANTKEKVKAAQQILEIFAKVQDPSKGRATKHSEEFITLSTDLEDFKKKFDDHTKPVQEEIEKQITEKNNTITQLSAKIKKCEIWLSTTGMAFGASLFAESAAAGILVAPAFGPLAPFVLVTALIVALGAAIAIVSELGIAIDKLVEINHLREQQHTLQTEVQKLTKDKSTIQQVQIALNSQTQKVVDVANRVDQMALIWSKVALNATKISSELGFINIGGTDPKDFKEQIKIFETNYKTLKEALVIYSTKVTSG